MAPVVPAEYTDQADRCLSPAYQRSLSHRHDQDALLVFSSLHLLTRRHSSCSVGRINSSLMATRRGRVTR
jgi:hypothetical protein